jgi:hypothetical protein
MNFSLQLNYQKNLDTLSWFHLDNSLQFHHLLWFKVLCSSLRSKHSVLILQTPITHKLTLDDSVRWLIGEDWCWLSPRSLGALWLEFGDNPVNFENFIQFLSTSK